MDLLKLHETLKPLLSDENITLPDGTTENPEYSQRIFTSLVLRFAPRQELLESYVVNISPRDNILNEYSCKELNNKLINLTETFGLNVIFYPEISQNNRYHYHGICWTTKDNSSTFTIYLKFLNKQFGNTTFQRILGYTTKYNAYNIKKKVNQTTTFENIIKYITKQVNNEKLLNYLNTDQKYQNKINKNKSFLQMTVTPCITTVKCNIIQWINEKYEPENENNIEIF